MLTFHYKIKFKLWKRKKNKMLAVIKKMSTIEICQKHEKIISSQLTIFVFSKEMFAVILKGKHKFSGCGFVLWKLPTF